MELNLCHKLKFSKLQPKGVIFQTQKLFDPTQEKYIRVAQLGCKDIGIMKSQLWQGSIPFYKCVVGCGAFFNSFNLK